jgi:putative ABC transport system substrate-binding protein
MHFRSLKRREFITLLGCAAAWPVGARGQQKERLRRIGVLYNLPAEDSEAQTRHAAFLQKLQELGWTVGRNVQIDTRWGGAGDVDRLAKLAAELVELAPDCLLATGSAGIAPLLRTTRTIPIVFVIVPDPVGAGIVASLARPGGNATGFTSFEYGIGAKWLALLKEAVPTLTRTAVLRDPTITAGIGWWGAIQSAAPAFNLEVVPVDVRDVSEMESALSAFAVRPGSGSVVVTGSPSAVRNRDLIISLAHRYRLPAIYFERFFAKAGGCSPTARTTSKSTDKQPSTWIASFEARSPPTFPFRRRPSTSWSST